MGERNREPLASCETRHKARASARTQPSTRATLVLPGSSTTRCWLGWLLVQPPRVSPKSGPGAEYGSTRDGGRPSGQEIQAGRRRTQSQLAVRMGHCGAPRGYRHCIPWIQFWKSAPFALVSVVHPGGQRAPCRGTASAAVIQCTASCKEHLLQFGA